jgi:hypothetical protein
MVKQMKKSEVLFEALLAVIGIKPIVLLYVVQGFDCSVPSERNGRPATLDNIRNDNKWEMRPSSVMRG